MSVLTKIFSSGAGELIKSVGGVIDNLTTSKEEKLEAERKIQDLIANHEVEMEKNISVRQLPRMIWVIVLSLALLR